MHADTYLPDLPEDDWRAVRPFVHGIVTAVRSQLPYPLASLMSAVARHVDWCVNVAYLPMDRETLFTRETIGAAVSMMPTQSQATKGTRRSLLLRVGEALGVIPIPSYLASLSAATPSTPYSPSEVEELSTWAHTQASVASTRSARVLLALGLGAGLPTRDIGAVRNADVSEAGQLVCVGGRGVRVRDEWSAELSELVAAGEAGSTLLFQPHVARSKNFVTNFVMRSIGVGIRPSTQRMRSTWLVAHLAEGTPMQDLLAMAGHQSMDALVRYEQFLPPASATALASSG